MRLSQIRGQIVNMYDAGYHTSTKSFHLFFSETVLSCSRFSAVVKPVVSRKETNAFYLSDLPTCLLVGQPNSGPTNPSARKLSLEQFISFGQQPAVYEMFANTSDPTPPTRPYFSSFDNNNKFQMEGSNLHSVRFVSYAPLKVKCITCLLAWLLSWADLLSCRFCLKTNPAVFALMVQQIMRSNNAKMGVMQWDL